MDEKRPQPQPIGFWFLEAKAIPRPPKPRPEIPPQESGILRQIKAGEYTD